jgi:hypothetical protein
VGPLINDNKLECDALPQSDKEQKMEKSVRRLNLMPTLSSLRSSLKVPQEQKSDQKSHRNKNLIKGPTGTKSN